MTDFAFNPFDDATRRNPARLYPPRGASIRSTAIPGCRSSRSSLIGNAVLELLDHPAELVRLRADRSLLQGAVEEVMRFSSPLQLDPRRATRRIELRGEVVEPDQIVVSWLGSANRDEEVFADPDRFDIARQDNRHIGFGFGLHYCLGANLARLEAQVALAALLDRTRAFARTTSAPLPLHPSIVFRAVTALPLRLVEA